MAEEAVLSINKWSTNGKLIYDCARIGLLHKEWSTLDVTYGYGTFWTDWRPDHLVACDLNPAKSPIGYSVDFTKLPFPTHHYDVVVFDGPYKLNGTPTDDVDERYGVDETATWQERMALLRAGARECARVARRMLLIKCQDQVVSSKIRWQTRAMCDEVEPLGWGLRARFDFLSRRAQPEGRNQINPASCSSQLLVFEWGWDWTDLTPQPEAVPAEQITMFEEMSDA
jgi:hypothetical protein